MKLVKPLLIFFGLLGLQGESARAQKVEVHVVMDTSKALPGSDTIYYDPNRKLTWDDFQGRPELNSPAGAATASGFGYRFTGENDGTKVTIILTVHTYFLKKNSWKKPGTQLPYHLQHEQIHFDITRLGAEKLVTEFRNGVYTAANYSQIIKNIYGKVNVETIARQQQYDLQTKNSREVEMQAEWNGKISKEVEALQ